MSMHNVGLQALEDFGCHPDLLAFLDEELVGVTVVSRKAQGKGDYCLLLADQHAQSAAYVERNYLNLALDSEDADSVMHQTGLGELERNPTTCRVRVPVQELVDDARRGIVAAALRRAVARSASGPAGGGDPLGRPVGARDYAICPTCFMQMSAAGCDEHGQPG